MYKKKIITIEKFDKCELPPSHSYKKYDEDIICLDVPLTLRLLEFSRESGRTDLDLHFLTKNMISLMKHHECLTIDHYKEIVEDKTKAYETPVVTP